MPPDRRQFLHQVGATGVGLYLSSGLPADSRSCSAEPTAITCRVTDSASGRELAARVRLLDAQGRETVPLGHPENLAEGAQEGDVRFQTKRFCYVDGQFQINSSAFPLKYQVIKGYEYGIAEGAIDASSIKNGTMVIPLSRWSSLSQKGWYSGDIHIHHITPKTCRLEMDAEDLNVANILTSDFTFERQPFDLRQPGVPQ